MIIINKVTFSIIYIVNSKAITIRTTCNSCDELSHQSWNLREVYHLNKQTNKHRKVKTATQKS